MRSNERIFDTPRDTQRVYLSMKTSFKLRKELVGKDGLCPIYLHVSTGGQRERINTQERVKSTNWLIAKQRANPIDKEHQDLNLILDNIQSKLTGVKTTYRLSDVVLSAKQLKNELAEDMPRVNFVSYMARKIEEEKLDLRAGTFRRYNAVLSKLRTYRDTIMFAEITEKFFKDYRKYLKKLGNQETTINSNVKAIKKYLKEAHKDGIRTPVRLDEIRSGSTSGNRMSLQPEEVKKFIEHYFSATMTKREHLSLGYFLFACVTGLRVSDVQNLKRHEVLSNDISFISVKTQKNQTISLNKTARKVIDYLPELFENHIPRNHINKMVQDIAKELDVTKPVSFHIARHTFATNFLRAGGKVEYLQQLLGHSKIETTMVYAHIMASEANDQITLLDRLLQ